MPELDKVLLADVAHEIEMLRQHATVGEKSRLHFNTLSPNNKFECIYGQMTGSCESARAKELMGLGCLTGYGKDIENFGVIIQDDFESIWGSPRMYSKGEYYRSYQYYSPLELYLKVERKTKFQNIIDYIQNKTNMLIL